MRLYARKLAHFKNSRSAKTCGARQAHQAPPAMAPTHTSNNSKAPSRKMASVAHLDSSRDGWMAAGKDLGSRENHATASQEASSRIVHAGTERILPPPPPLGIHLCCFPPRIRQSLRAMTGSGRRKATTLRAAFRKSWLFSVRLPWRRHVTARPPASRPPPPGLFGLGRHLSATRLSPFWAQIFRQFTTSPPYLRAMDTNSHELTAAPSFLTQLRCHGLI